LKQFIAANTSEMRADITKLQNDVSRIDEKVDALTEFVVDALGMNRDTNETRFSRLEERVGVLEQTTA